MPTRNFVVQNGLTVGPLSIDAATGSITTSGNVNITGNLGVTQIARNDSSISLNDTGGFSNVLITVDGSLKANVNPLGFDITNGNIRMNNNWLIGTGGINSTGNILGAVGSFGSINSTGFFNTSGNVSGAVVNAGALNVNGGSGFINTSGNVSAATVLAGALTSSGFINTSGNLSVGGNVLLAGNTSHGTAGVVSGAYHNFVGNINQYTSGGAVNFTTAGNVNATSGWVNAGTVYAAGNIIGATATLSGLTLGAGSINSVGAITATGFFNTTANVSGAQGMIGSLGVGTTASGTTGEIRATNNITAYFSDQRLKENITVIPNALEKLDRISGVTYISNDLAATFGYTDKTEQVGVLAQELKQVLPHVVKLAPFDTEYVNGVETSKSGENYMTVQYERIIPLLVQAIKELKAEVDQLKSKE